MTNRIQEALAPPSAAATLRAVRADAAHVTDAAHGHIVDASRASVSVSAGAHALFAPLHYERNYAYPLLVWLHGPDDNERQLLRIMPHVSMRNYVAVAPCAMNRTKADPSWRGFAWSQQEHDLELAEERIADSIELAQRRYRIAAQRVFVAGYRCGGTMALRFGLRNPHLVAGVLSFGGALPTGGAPLARLREVRNLPIMLAMCRDSRTFGPTEAGANLRLLHSAGMLTHLRQYPCDDCITTQMLGDMDRWIMELVNGQ